MFYNNIVWCKYFIKVLVCFDILFNKLFNSNVIFTVFLKPLYGIGMSLIFKGYRLVGVLLLQKIINLDLSAFRPIFHLLHQVFKVSRAFCSILKQGLLLVNLCQIAISSANCDKLTDVPKFGMSAT